MKKIDWKSRILNPTFWLTLIPAVLLLVQVVLNLFGIDWNCAEINKTLVLGVNSLFTILTIVGVVIDPKTKGIGD